MRIFVSFHSMRCLIRKKTKLNSAAVQKMLFTLTQITQPRPMEEMCKVGHISTSYSKMRSPHCRAHPHRSGTESFSQGDCGIDGEAPERETSSGAPHRIEVMKAQLAKLEAKAVES
jgi:hypothetical protein